MKPIVGLPPDLEPESRLVGQREPAGLLVVAVLLREDVGHVLVGDGAAEAADDRGCPPIRVALERPTSEPFELLELRRQHQHDADAWKVAQVGAEPHLVLDQQGTGGEQTMALPVEHVVPTPAARPLVHHVDTAADDVDRLHPQLDPVEPELEPAAERRDAPLRDPIGEQAQTVVVGRRAPELQRGPDAQDVASGRSGELGQHAGLAIDDRPCPRRPRAQSLRRLPSAACGTLGPQRGTRAGSTARVAATPPRGRRGPTQRRGGGRSGR